MSRRIFLGQTSNTENKISGSTIFLLWLPFCWNTRNKILVAKNKTKKLSYLVNKLLFFVLHKTEWRPWHWCIISQNYQTRFVSYHLSVEDYFIFMWKLLIGILKNSNFVTSREAWAHPVPIYEQPQIKKYFIFNFQQRRFYGV